MESYTSIFYIVCIAVGLVTIGFAALITYINRNRNNDPDEYIICAAVWFKTGMPAEHQPTNVNQGFVICGRRHHNCFATMKVLTDNNLPLFKTLRRAEQVQGFLTNKNRFVDREEAMKIAVEFGQVNRVSTRKNEELFSEDLY